ncbi:hypothetical protein ACPCTO_09740 [Streptomyces olivoreticuli]
MSVLTAIHTRHCSTRRHGTVLAFLATAVRRIADSPLDSTVLRAAPVTAPTPRAAAHDQPERPHAHWHMVTGPDGRRHLEAVWHLTH